MTIEIFNNHFQLDSNGVAFWQEKNILLIADVHLGKISHFRKNGSAVPQTAIQRNFDRLTKAVTSYKPKKLLFLGDLFHSVLNAEWVFFENWIKNLQIPVILISGNHDVIAPVNYSEINVEVLEELIIDPFLFTHHPEDRQNLFNICGHIHPGYRLVGKGKQFLKLKCFFRSKNQLILPAFGEFTGCFIMKPSSEDQIYACADTSVIQIC